VTLSQHINLVEGFILLLGIQIVALFDSTNFMVRSHCVAIKDVKVFNDSTEVGESGGRLWALPDKSGKFRSKRVNRPVCFCTCYFEMWIPVCDGQSRVSSGREK
jgi:hypothetical protein